MFLFIISVIFPYQTICSQREIVLINDNWKFSESNSDVDNNWENVNIPHTWNKDAYSTRDYKRGTHCYKKQLFIPKEKEDKALYLRFEAVNSLAYVYINDVLLKTHKGGYGAFVVDITGKVTSDSQNAIAIKVDNRNEDIPPLSGDFTIFGGIYRDVWLITVGKQHFSLDGYLPEILKRPFIIGAAEWNFIDFSSASRQESMPHINNKGLIYADRIPKDVYYYFQSFLRKDIPVLHIAADDWKKWVLVSDSKTGPQPKKHTTSPHRLNRNKGTISLIST